MNAVECAVRVAILAALAFLLTAWAYLNRRRAARRREAVAWATDRGVHPAIVGRRSRGRHDR